MTDVKLEDAERVVGVVEHFANVASIPAEMKEELKLVAALLRKIPELEQNLKEQQQWATSEIDGLKRQLREHVETRIELHRKLTEAQGRSGEPTGEWRDIDEAPSNVKVILYGPYGIECGYASHGWPRNSQGISNMSYHGSATHWMPLPEPPK
ncbi:MAG TPA: DUF551 domain-containing protein [Candidatus Limnocylindrales bacterium]|nr:DUF551 domain-containing protein [Candidatus Limnocylindrales bacterium]